MTLCVLICAILVLLAVAGASGKVPEYVGGRLELFVDDYLIESMGGAASLELHQPMRREIVFKTDAPWEGNAAAYQSVFKDGDIYRLYYHGVHYRHSGEPAQAREDHPWNLCYAESTDGINWTRPELGLFEFNGSKANNIIVTKQCSRTPTPTAPRTHATRSSSSAASPGGCMCSSRPTAFASR